MATADLLAQRTPAARPRPAYTSLTQASGTPSSPHTPLLSRSLSSQYGSPGGYRVEDEHVVYEFGSRFFRAGFSGDAAPKAIWQFCPGSSRRAGDYGSISESSYTCEDEGHDAIGDWELWDYDVANLDLSLVEDKLERALRVMNEKHLMLDLKARSAIVALPPCLPNPLVELVLKAIFTGLNQPRSLYLMSSPILSVVGAGLRSGLVVDVGWHETTITAVYEYRETLQRRSVRGSKLLSFHTQKMLLPYLSKSSSGARKVPTHLIEDVVTRLLFCRLAGQAGTGGDMIDGQVDLESPGAEMVPHADFAEPVEFAFFDADKKGRIPDDHDVPLHALIWRTLLALPFDVRAICVSRIIFTGGASSIPGLKARLLEEVEMLVEQRGWDPISSYGTRSQVPSQGLQGPTLVRKRRKSRRRPGGARIRNMPLGMVEEEQQGAVADELSEGSAEEDERSEELVEDTVPEAQQQAPGQTTDEERDEITEKLEREALRSRPPPVKAVVRGVETLGAWAGASLVGHLRIEGSIEIKKDDFMKNGINILGYPI